MRSQCRLFLPLLLLLLGGCFTRETRILLEEDGSGVLEIVTTARKALLDYARAHVDMPPEEWWFSEPVLTQAAKQYGQGVQYLDHEITPLDDGKKFKVRYRFEDVSQLDIRVDTDAPFYLTPPGKQQDHRPRFRLVMRDNVFTVQVPPASLRTRSSTQARVRVDAPKAQAQRKERLEQDLRNLMRHGNPFKLTGKESAEEMVKALAEGMRFQIQVQLPGPVLASNARTLKASVEGEEAESAPVVTLFSLDAMKVLEDKSAMEKATEGEIHRIGWSELIRLPGVSGEHTGPVHIHLRP
ncbi:MAG: hypothetical protein JJU29_00945 [Verrucomicrobia bacterium]|nr:hypothetical protein [Verrucomicrobiota bacterium]MCH8510526.1 hypothetical protein [Kiritimatiellia bacterium]